MLPPSSVTRNPSKQNRSASCAELWIIGRSDTTTLRASRYRLFGKRGAGGKGRSKNQEVRERQGAGSTGRAGKGQSRRLAAFCLDKLRSFSNSNKSLNG